MESSAGFMWPWCHSSTDMLSGALTAWLCFRSPGRRRTWRRSRRTAPTSRACSSRAPAGTGRTWSSASRCPRSSSTRCPSSCCGPARCPSSCTRTSTCVPCTKPAPGGGRCPPRDTPPTTSCPSSCPPTGRRSTGSTVAWPASASWTTRRSWNLFLYAFLRQISS